MKKCILSSCFFMSIFAYSQMGVNTTQPKTTFDIRGKTDATGKSLPTDVTGFQAPRLTREELTLKGDLLYGTDQVGATIYITDVLTGDNAGTRANILEKGYYYFDGVAWQKFGSGNVKEQFYAPSIVLPTVTLGVSTNALDDISFAADVFTVKLHSIYKKQFGMAGNIVGASRTALKSSATAVLKEYEANELDYFITYFDNTVFDPTSITLSTNGVLTYKVLGTGVVSEKTFMNIVFKVK